MPGFVEVCEQIVEDGHEDWAAEEPMTLAETALAIDGIEARENEEWDQTWLWLCRGASRVDAWRGLDENGGRGIIAILRHCQTIGHADLIEKTLNGLSISVSGDEEDVPPEPWLRGALHIVNYLHESNQDEVLRRSFRVPGPPAFYIEVTRILVETGLSDDLRGYFSPQTRLASIEEGFMRRVDEGELEESDVDVIHYLRSIYEAEDDLWEGLYGSLQRKMQSGPNLETQQVVACVKAMLDMAYDDIPPELDSTIEGLCSQGYLMSHLYDAQTAGDFEATAACLLSIVDFYPQGTPQVANWNAQPGHNNYTAILRNPGAIRTSSRLLLGSSGNSAGLKRC